MAAKRPLHWFDYAFAVFAVVATVVNSFSSFLFSVWLGLAVLMVGVLGLILLLRFLGKNLSFTEKTLGSLGITTGLILAQAGCVFAAHAFIK